MISLSLLPLSFLMFQKSVYSLASSFLMESYLLYMVSIFPLIYFLLKAVFFNFSRSSDLFVYDMIFFSLFPLLFFCFSSDFSMLFLFFLECTVLFMLLFVLNYAKDSDKFGSVVFMFFINSLGSVPFMYFCLLCPFSLLAGSFYLDLFLSFFTLFCFSFILCSKLPVVFLHFWLTKAHVSASGSGSMILASLMLKLGSFGLLKFSFLFLSLTYFNLKNLILIFSLLSMISMLILMSRFFDLKYMVACSSILHMSLIFPLLLFLSPLGSLSCMLMMVGHGIISCFIFFLVTIVYEFSYNRSSEMSKSMESLGKSLALYFFIFFLMNMGFPPFVSFISELFFLSFVNEFGFLSLLLFCSCLMISGKVFVTVLLLSLFGKKSAVLEGTVDASVSSYSSLSLISFFFSPFFFL